MEARIPRIGAPSPENEPPPIPEPPPGPPGRNKKGAGSSRNGRRRQSIERLSAGKEPKILTNDTIHCGDTTALWRKDDDPDPNPKTLILTRIP